MKSIKVTDVNPLLGQFFHSLGADKKIEWQGCVIGSPEPGWYLVQLFEWTMGEPNVRKLVPLEDMEHWLFYKTAEEMKFSYDKGIARLGGKYRREILCTTA